MELARHARDQPSNCLLLVVVLVCRPQERDGQRRRPLVGADRQRVGLWRGAGEAAGDFTPEQRGRQRSDSLQASKVWRGVIPPVGPVERIDPGQARPRGAVRRPRRARGGDRRVERHGAARQVADGGEQREIRGVGDRAARFVRRLRGVALQLRGATTRVEQTPLRQQAARLDVVAVRRHRVVQRRNGANVEVRQLAHAALPQKGVRENRLGPRGQLPRQLRRLERRATERLRFDQRGIGDVQGRLPQPPGDDEVAGAGGLCQPNRFLEGVERLLGLAAFHEHPPELDGEDRAVTAGASSRQRRRDVAKQPLRRGVTTAGREPGRPSGARQQLGDVRRWPFGGICHVRRPRLPHERGHARCRA